jgi:hypothetical protein
MTTPHAAPHPEWEQLLAITHLDDLSPSQRSALEAHLASCSGCAAVHADYQRMDTYIQHVPTSRPLPAFPPQLLADRAGQRARQGNPPGTAPLSASENRSRLIPQQKGYTSMPTGRIRSVAAVVSVAVLVALFVLLFRGISAGSHSGSNPTSPQATNTNNTTPLIGQWQLVPGLANESSLPVLAPSDPRVVYETVASGTTPNQFTLRRSNDDGATWHNLPVPGRVPADVDNTSLAVSPLDASTVFFTYSLPSGEHPEECQPVQAAIAPLTSLKPQSGAAHCSIQYYSTDAGQHWNLLHLPIQGAALGAFAFPEFQTTSSTDIFRAQGQRLYSATGGPTIAGVVIGVTGIRIVSSTDGGKSWNIVDADLAASGQHICDYMPTPTGSTLFAITQTGDYCYVDSVSPNSLWRSDDAGAHWTQVSQLPSTADDLTLVERGGSAQPLIYARMPLSAQYETIDISCPPPALEVSADGGKTWHQAPTKGLPTKAAPNYGPLAVLSDGSIVKAFQVADQVHIAFYAWKLGQTSWQPITLAGTPNVAYALIKPSDGKVTIWLVANAGNGYQVQRFDRT